MQALFELLPDLAAREAWAVGLMVVLAVLRPVGRIGWTAAAALVAGTVAVLAGIAAPAVSAWSVVGIVAWIVLAGTLAATAVVAPLRWEPRTGPGAATALLVGAGFLHVGIAFHRGGAGLAEVADRWSAGTLSPSAIDQVSAGPLTWVLTSVIAAFPGADARGAAAALGVVAVVVTVVFAERLGRRWGYVGTARCTAAAVAWAPPLLVAHEAAPAALLATAALVASWWSLVEVWGGRHRAGRLSLASGALLGVAVGVSIWPLVVLPLWARRLGARSVGWFAVGFLAALLGAALALVPTTVGVADVWDAAVVGALADGLAPASVAGMLVVVAVAVLGLRRPLSPTRLSALTAALLLATVPWWPPLAAVAGPVAALPFVLLAAVAPDRPEERWPPDAVAAGDRERVSA